MRVDRAREKAHASKQGKFWCGHCDHFLVHAGERCPYCHRRNKRRELKKYLEAKP